MPKLKVKNALMIFASNLGNTPPDIGGLVDVNGGGVINKLLEILIKIPFLIFPFVIIIGGFMYMFAAGDEQRLKKAKRTLTWGIIGFVITLVAYGIVILFTKLVGANQVNPTVLPAPSF